MEERKKVTKEGSNEERNNQTKKQRMRGNIKDHKRIRNSKPSHTHIAPKQK